MTTLLTPSPAIVRMQGMYSCLFACLFAFPFYGGETRTVIGEKEGKRNNLKLKHYNTFTSSPEISSMKGVFNIVCLFSFVSFFGGKKMQR